MHNHQNKLDFRRLRWWIKKTNTRDMDKNTYTINHKRAVINLLLTIVILCSGFASYAQTTTFSGTGNWSDPDRWDNGVPDSTWDVNIADGADCAVDIDAFAKSLTFASGSSNSIVSISGTSTLTIEDELTYSIGTGTADQVLAVNDGTLICGSVFMPNSGNNNRNLRLTLNEGSVSIAGDLVMQGSHSRNYITFTGAGTMDVEGDFGKTNHGRLTADSGLIRIGGDFFVHTYTTNTSTIEFNGNGSQRIRGGNYYNLKINGSGEKYLSANSRILSNGNLDLQNGILDLAGRTLRIDNTASITGNFGESSMIGFSNGGKLHKYGSTSDHWSGTYPIGTGDSYSPMVITSSSNTNTNMYIEVFDQRHHLLNGSENALERYWLLTPANAALTISGYFRYSDSDTEPPIVETNLTKVGRLNAGGWQQNEPGAAFDHAINEISFNDIPARGAWTLGEDTGCFNFILPDKYTVANGNWSSPAVWNNGTVPEDGDNVVIMHVITNNVTDGINPNHLTITESGSLNLHSQNITVSGTTEVYGRITDSNNGGTNTFHGLVNIHEGGQITTGHNSPFAFEGDIINHGTFSKTGSGAVTFRENDLEISGTEEITMNGSVTVSDIIITNNGSIVFNNTAAMTGSGSWIQGEGSSLTIGSASIDINFNAEADYNKVTYGFSANQTINTTTDYYNLIIQGHSTKTITDQLDVTNDFIITNSTNNNLRIIAGINDIYVGGDFIVSNDNNNARLDQTTGNLQASNISILGDRAFIFISNSIATGNFNIDGNSTYTITANEVNADNFIARGGGTTNFSSNANITNNLELESNSAFNIGSAAGVYQLNIGNDIVTANSSSLGVTVNGLHTISVNNNVIANGIFDLFVNTSRNASLEFNSDVPHAITGSPETFRVFDLRLNPGSNITTANYDMTIAGSVEIGSGSTLDAGPYTHNVAMHWNNEGTLVSTGTFVFNGGNQTLNTESGFHNISFTAGGTKTFAGNMNIAGNLEVANTTVTLSDNNTPKSHVIGGDVTIHSGSFLTNNVDVVHDLSIGGNLTVNGNFRLHINANRYTTLRFTNDIARVINGTPNQFELFNLELAGSSNTTTLGFDLTTASGFILRDAIHIGNGASLLLNGYDVDLYENIIINAGGALNINDNAILTFRAAEKSIQNAGSLIIQGNPGNEAIINASAPVNRYFIHNTTGSSLVMKHYEVDYLTGEGISMEAGATSDIPEDNFSFGTFGPNSDSNQCLLLTGVDFNTNNPVTANSVAFNNTVGYNVSRTSGTGSIDFYDATGSRAGQSFENDNGNPGDLINWFYPSSTYFTVASGDFLDPAIWNTNPTGNFDNATSSFLISDGHNVVLNGDIDVLELIVGEGTSGSLAIGNSEDTRTLAVREHLTTMSGAEISVGSAATHLVMIYGNLVNEGSMQFRSTSSNVADVSFFGINSKINGANTVNFNSVIFASGTITTAYQPMNIQRNVIIENNAIFDDAGFTHTVGRDWTETGSGRRTGEGTIEFNGVVNTISSTDGSDVEFFNVVCSGAGGTDFTTIDNVFTTYIYGDLAVNDSKEVRLINDHMVVSGDFIIDGAAKFSSSNSVVTFDGNTPQNINLSSDAAFRDLVFSGNGVKNVTGNITTSRFLTIESGATVEGAGSHDIGNTMTIDGTCNFSGSITMRAGNITSNNTEIHLPNLTSLYIAGNIFITTTSSLNIIAGGNVEVTSNYLVINENTSLTSTGSGSFILGDGLNLYVRAVDGFPSGFASYQLSESSTVRYDRDLPQIIRGGADVVYGNLRIGNAQNANPQIRQADGEVNIHGDLRFDNSTRQITFDLNGSDLTIGENITDANSSTIEMSAGGTLTLNAEDANQTVSVGTYNLTNLMLELDAPSATRTKTFTDGATINISGNLTVTCGSAGTFINNVIFNNNSITGPANDLVLGENTQLATTAINAATNIFDAFAGDIDLINSTVYFANRDVTQFIPHTVTYGNVTFRGTRIKEATGPLTIAGSVSVTADTPYFKAAGFTHSVAGDWLLGTGNTRLADMSPDDRIIFNGIDQYTLPSNFMHLEIASSGTASISGGNIVVFGDFTVKNDATFEAGVRNITIHGDWLVEPTGIFTQEDNGVVFFAGQNANQSITSNENSYFWNVTINKNQGEENQTVFANSDINLRNNLDLTTNAAVFNLNDHQLNVGRNLTIRNNTHIDHNPFIAGTGTVVLDGYHDVQHIHHYSSHDLVFHNLVFNSPTNKYVRTTNTASPPSRNVILTGDWINNFENVYGYFIHQGNSYVDFFVQGNWINNGTFIHTNNGTVTFNGVDQQIGSSDFWNVVFANEGIKTLTNGHMTVRRDLLIEDGVTLDVSEDDYNILVARHWDMSAEGAVFNARNGLVRFDGNGTIFTGLEGESPDKSFWDIDISASVSINGDLDVDNNFRIISGTFTTGTNKVFIGGDFSNNGTFSHSNNPETQVIFNATTGPRTIDPGPGVDFNTLILEAPGVTYNVLNDFSVNRGYDLTLNGGILNLNSNILRINSHNTRVVINPGGELNVNENATVEFNGSNQHVLNQGGVLRAVGTTDFNATFTRVGGSYYITQTSGIFHAQHYRFEMIGAGANGGITISGGTIDAENNFSNGSFISGTSSANTTAYLNLNDLEIDNTADLVMSNVIFNGGGSTNRNIWRNTPPADPHDGIVICQDCIGTLAGPNFEIDDGQAESGFVHWTYPSGFFWEGTVSESWHENLNWEGGTAPSEPYHNVYFDPGTYTGPYNTALITQDVSCGNIIILNNSSDLGFEVGDDQTLVINGLLNIEPGGVASLSSASSRIEIYSHWQNAGIFVHGGGAVRFMAPSSTINILPGSSNNFYNLEINSPGNAVFALGSDIEIENNLSIFQGTLDVLARDITIGGNWFMEASAEANFDPRNRTVFFTGSGQSITNGTFSNLELTGSGTTTLESNITTSRDIIIGTNATLDGQNFDLYVGRNWTNNNLFVQTGTGTVVFNGGNQQVDNGSQVTRFNRVIFAGSGTKTFHQASEIWGDLTINNGSSVNFSTFIIDGGVAVNSLVNNGTMLINGPNNFPENFESISMAPNSRVYYNYNGGDQVIRTNDATWAYGNLYLGNNSGNLYRKVPNAGNLTIAGTLHISHTDVILDMEQNSTDMTLTGNISLPAGGQQINWGTGTTKLTHVGGDWTISANITGFNNLELGGPSNSWKRMANDLVITGDVTIKNGVRLMMDPNNNNNPKTMTCIQPGKTFTMESNARLYSAITSDIGVAAPTGFENYSLANNSRFYLRSPNGTEQTLFTGNGIEYGNLYFQNTKHVLNDGVAALRVNGLLDTGSSSFDDNGQDIFVRLNAYLHDYTASPGTTFTFFGPAQTITNGSALNFHNAVFSGSGLKNLGNREVVNITGNLHVSSNVMVASGRDIYFKGENWNCEGRFEHSGGRTVFVSGTEEQYINPGPLNESNLFRNIEFTGDNDVNFIENGATILGNFTISGNARVNMGELSHQITGNIMNITGGTLLSAQADITFNGGTQSIHTPDFEANNVNVWGTGTKRMFSNWTVNGDMHITSTLNNQNNIDNSFHDIEARSNWFNSGTFSHNNNGWVNFIASSEAEIDNGSANFFNVSFGNDEGDFVIYNLTAPNTSIRRSMEINQDAHVLLNGNTLTLGTNIAEGKNYLVRGFLDADAGSRLVFDNRGSVCTLLVDNAENPARASLRLLGTSDNVATLTRIHTAGTQVIIDHGIIEARYYLIEFLSNNGIDIRPNATLHPSNNFSNGTFSNISNVAGARYLRLEAGTYEGGEIENIAFNITGVPVAGIINVERQLSDPPVTFGGIITGELGGYRFEKDELTELPAVPEDAARGRLRWPQVTETQWTGIVNADWNNPDNWSDDVPTSAMDAVIPGGVPNDPVLNADAFCKNLRITSGTLELDGGYHITTYGDITIGEGTALGRMIVSSPESVITCGGSWTRGTNGQFIHGNGTVVFNTASASATISPLNSNFHNVVFDNSGALFTLNGAVINILGDLELLNGTLVPGTSNYTINLGGDFNNQGDFIHGNGTVLLNGTVDQTITNGVFNHLTVAGSSTKFTTNECIIHGNTFVNSTLQANDGSTIDFRGNVLIEAGATFHDGDQTHTFNGAVWTGTGNYLGEGTVIFNRTNSNQVLNTASFHNLEIACTGRVLTLGGDVSVSGNMNIRGGVNRLDIWDHLITNTSGLGEFYAENAVTIRITGANHFPANFFSYFLERNTTVDYMGEGDQIIRGGLDVVYGRLLLTNSSVKTLDGDIEIQRDLRFNSATLDVSPDNYTITISEGWNNNNAAGGTFIPRHGEVIFNRPDGNQSITVHDNSENPFFNLTVDKTANFTLSAPNNKDQIIQNNLTVIDGRYSARSRTTVISGDMVAVNGTFISDNSGTFLLNKPSGDAIIRTNYNYSNNNGAIRNLTINSGATYTLESDFAAYGDINIASGTFNGNGHQVALGSSSAHSIQINGTYIFGTGGRLHVGRESTITVGSSGVFEMVGTPDQNAVLSNNMHHGGRYGFVMNGLIKAEHYQFMFMNVNGIRITSSGLIDATHNLSNGTFTHGASNTTFLAIENNQTFVEPNYIANVNFPTSPGGATAKNVSKNLDEGRIEFYEASGNFAGQLFENDPFDRVDWTGQIVLTWNGSVNSDWNNADNWTASFGPGIVPTGNEDVIITNVMNSPRLTVSGQRTKKLTINPGARLIIETDYDDANTDLEILGDFEILGNGTLEISSVNDFVTLAGSWFAPNTATLINNGHVTFNGTGAVKTINNGNKSFYNLTIEGSTSYVLANHTTVRNNFTILEGASLDLSASNFSMQVAGNWSNNGSFIPRSGTVTFNALSATRTINNGSSSFHHATINAPGSTYNLAVNDLRINGNMNLVAGTFNQNQRTVFMGDGIGSDELNVSLNGVYLVGPDGVLSFGANAQANITNGGVFRAVGTGTSNRAVITSSGSGTYGFTVESTGTFGAQYYLFEYMNTSGIHLRPGAILDGVNNLSNGVFSNGAPGGTYLWLENEMPSHPDDEDIINITFNNGPTYNITRLTGGTVVNISDAFGPMGNYTYEHDAVMPASPTSGLITWSLLNTSVWTGATDNNWHNAANWLGEVPNETKNVEITSGGIQPVIFEGQAFAQNISIANGAVLTINDQNLTISEELWFAGTITAIGSPHITVGGSWVSASGRFNAGQSRVVLNAAAGLNTVNQSTGNFYDLEIASGGTYNQESVIRLNNDLILTSGTYSSNERHTYVAGSWINTGGTFVAGTRTVFFNGSGDIVINPGASAFYNINFSGSANAVLGANVNVSLNFVQSAGTINMNGFNLTVSRRFSLTGGEFAAGSGTLTIGENLVISGTGILDPGTSNIVMTSISGTRSITPRNQQFYNLTINGNALFNLQGAMVLQNDLNILRGTLSVTTNNHPVSITGNILNNGAFSQQSGTVTLNGTNPQQIAGTSAVQRFFNLVVENSSDMGVTLNRTVTITGNLSLNNGRVNTSASNILIVANGATASEGSDNSFVNGPVRKVGNQEFLFPIGKNHIYAPLHITAPNLASNAFTAEYFPQTNTHANHACSNCSADIMNVSTNEYWDLTRNSGTATPDVTLFFRDMVRSGIMDVDDLILAHFNGTQWVSRGQGGLLLEANMCSVTGTGFTSYSPLTAASQGGNNPLPIELLFVDAECNDSAINVNWATAAEINNDYFSIEASADGINYETVGYVDGAGNSNIRIDYSFTFTPEHSGLTYIKLKQTDFDGEFEYFGPVVVSCIEETVFEPEIVVYPNPTRGQITVHGIGQNSRIVIYDQLMKVVKTVESQETSAILNLTGNEPGVYFIQVHSNSKQFVRRVILQR